MSNYTFERLDSTRFDVLVSLMRDCFGMETNIDYFKWKFLDNPAGNFIGFIAVENDTKEIAAYYGVIPEKYVINGQETTIYQSGDTMTHSRHRRKGLFKKLAAHCYDYLRENDKLFIIGFGGPESTPGLIKLGWKELFDFRFFFIPKILCYPSLLLKFDDVEAVSDFKALEPLAQKGKRTEIYSFRDATHLKWRYGNPLHSHQVLAFKNASRIEGYVCFYIQGNKIILLDFVFETDVSRKSLLGSLKKRVAKEKLKGIVALCRYQSRLASELKSSGFLINPFNKGPLSLKRPFLFHADEETMTKFSSPDCWSITSYDLDAL